MKLRTRVLFFGAVYLFGFVLLTSCLPAALVHDYIPHLVFGWFLIFAIGQFFVFRCPHCHKLAMFGPYHRYHPTIGSRCRHCGKDY